MTESTDPDLSWTDAEDTYCVWSFLMNPIGGITDHCRMPPGRQIRDLLPRFREIIASPLLQERVLAYCGGDIVRLHRVMFAPLEDFAIAKVQHYLHTTNGETIIDVFGPYFHLSRSPASVFSRIALQVTRGSNSWSTQLQAYQRFKDLIYQKTSGTQLVEISTKPEDIEPALLDEKLEPLKRAVLFDTVGQMYAHVQERFSESDFFALRGSGKAFFCSRACTTIGRRTAADPIDVDIGEFAGKHASRLHATISLAWDMAFYLEVIGRFVIVNGSVFPTGKIVKLRDLDVLDIGTYVCMFMENVNLMAELRATLDQEPDPEQEEDKPEYD
jgi:hypothetical protein